MDLRQIAWYSAPDIFHVFSLISLASASRSSGEAASAEPDGGPGASGTLHAGAVLPRRPFLQPGEEGSEERWRGSNWEILNTCKCLGSLSFEEVCPISIFILGRDPLLDLWPGPRDFHVGVGIFTESCFLSVPNRHSNRKRCWNRGTTVSRDQLGYCPHDQVIEIKITVGKK